MALWQRPARVGLASFAVTLGVLLLYSLSDRAEAPPAETAPPIDPQAVIESRGARITLGDGSVIVAERQFSYEDGSSRMMGVEVIVPSGSDRTEFRLRGGEAAGGDETGEWRLGGDVTIETADGLTGRTPQASYTDGDGVVRMPEPVVFEQGWMRLAADAARYDRRAGVVHLDRQAVVELQLGAGPDAPGVRIASDNAGIHRDAGVMRFHGAVTVDAGRRRMLSDAVIVRFEPDTSQLDLIELTGGAQVLGQGSGETDVREMSAETIAVRYRDDALDRAVLTGGARIVGGAERPGQLRDLSAPAIDVDYRGGEPERATLRGGARVELFGADPGTPGVTIAGGSVEVALQAGAAGVGELAARDRATLTFPAQGGAGRRIHAQTLAIGGAAPGGAAPGEEADPAGGDGLAAVFDGGVELRESGGAAESAPEDRIMRADRMEAVLAEGLAQMTTTRFTGNVALASGGLRAEADEATYAPDARLFTLLAADAAAGRIPRLDDERGFLQAETIAIGLDGPDVEAAGEVKGVLASAEADGAGGVRPGLFDSGPVIHIVAGRFVRNAGQSLATYSGGARLWQGTTAFRGETIVLDESTGNISAEGTVETRTTMRQNADDPADPVESATEASAGTLFFDNARRHAAYGGGARVASPQFTLAGENIELFLRDDARTLHRIEALDDIALELDTRSVTGATLSYDDAEGRYDLTGEPVRVIEDLDGECRETTGRTLSFHANGESVSADGQSAERTFSASGSCDADGSF